MKYLLLNFSIDSSKGNKFRFVEYANEDIFMYLVRTRGVSIKYNSILFRGKEVGELSKYAYHYSTYDDRIVYNGFVVNGQRTYDMMCEECKNLIVEQCQKDKNLGLELIKRNIHVIGK